MKKLIILFFILIFGTCSISTIKLYKPFIITEKDINYSPKGNCLYTYQDRHGIEREFIDIDTKYDIGDTIH